MARRKPSPALKAFGAVVRHLREEANITRTELAKRVAVTPSYISQVESGHTRCRKDFAQRMDQALGTDDQLTAAWTKHLRSATYPKFFAEFSEAEASAELLRAYEATFVTGLLQTKEYAQVLLPSQSTLDGRLKRQQILFRELQARALSVSDSCDFIRKAKDRWTMRPGARRSAATITAGPASNWQRSRRRWACGTPRPLTAPDYSSAWRRSARSWPNSSSSRSPR
ncbi:Helix-turn-helix domain-containing protein [Actinomadura meyerae]|uniref:Helix-turn-helix domain-containing protein n=1 Tax=Actinomadura meyerae TaxID=240840 RepID=A0A239FQV0_9ACTN|nr:Helix-turn-helix domain-containing protein [Actinomadura meyerae]